MDRKSENPTNQSGDGVTLVMADKKGCSKVTLMGGKCCESDVLNMRSPTTKWSVSKPALLNSLVMMVANPSCRMEE